MLTEFPAPTSLPRRISYIIYDIDYYLTTIKTFNDANMLYVTRTLAFVLLHYNMTRIR